MDKGHRIAFEILAPPGLGAVVAMIAACIGDHSFNAVSWILVIFAAAYVLAILPSFLYAVIMELWFESRIYRLFGHTGAILLSTLYGAGTGWIMFHCVDVQLPLPICGSVVGFLIGSFLTFRFRPVA